jgi:isocitrate dehydrogenase
LGYCAGARRPKVEVLSIGIGPECEMAELTGPSSGDPITLSADGVLSVPARPIIPFIEGDGSGPDIWNAARAILDAAVARAYAGKRRIAWYEVYAGDKAERLLGNWLPERAVSAFRKYRVGIMGPLAAPVGEAIGSLNVALRQQLDLDVCLAPVRWLEGVADITVDQGLTRPEDLDVVASSSGSGERLSPLPPPVGGICIAPCANINYTTGHAVFEASHGTAAEDAGQDKANPSSLTASGEMLLRHMGWNEAADLVTRGLSGAIAEKTVTYDFARLMDGAKLVKCSEFAQAVITHIG